jgi:hypothetical protein
VSVQVMQEQEWQSYVDRSHALSCRCPAAAPFIFTGDAGAGVAVVRGPGLLANGS